MLTTPPHPAQLRKEQKRLIQEAQLEKQRLVQQEQPRIQALQQQIATYQAEVRAATSPGVAYSDSAATTVPIEATVQHSNFPILPTATSSEAKSVNQSAGPPSCRARHGRPGHLSQLLRRPGHRTYIGRTSFICPACCLCVAASLWQLVDAASAPFLSKTEVLTYARRLLRENAKD